MRDYLLKGLALALLALLVPVAVVAGERVALVIGNNAYQQGGALNSAVNDAQRVGDALQGLGFRVIRKQDLDYSGLLDALDELGKAATGADWAVVYYAGHGIQVEGNNHLIPVDVGLNREGDLRRTVLLDDLLTEVNQARELGLVILDACRDNPFAARLNRGAGRSVAGRGLARVEQTGTNTLVAFATRENTIAADSGVYAAALVRHLATPGLEVERLFGRVRDEVMARTANAQQPFTYGSLGGGYYAFKPGPSPPPDGSRDRELVFWNSVKDSRNPAVFRIYLDQYPGGTFARLAQIRLAELEPPAPPVETRQPLKLGVIAELTGDMPTVGASCKNAAEMAVKEVNAAGGLQVGKEKMKVQLVVEDNAGKADQSAAAAQKLITQDEVLAIVGPNASRYAIPAAEIAESEKTVLITPWSTNPKTTRDASTNQPKKYVFRAAFIDPFQGRVLAKFALETLKAQKAAVLYDVGSDYNRGIAEVFRANYERLGGKIVAFETYTPNDKDFSAQLTKIKNTKPDVIFLPNYYNEVPLQVQQAKRLWITTPFIGSDSWGSNELLTLGGADLNGYYFSTHYAADNAAPVARRFVQNYQRTYGAVPDDVAALTYDAFGLLFGAIQGAGKADREAIRAALSTLPTYQGVTGDIKFQADSRDPIKSAVIVQIKDSKFTFVTNAKP